MLGDGIRKVASEAVAKNEIVERMVRVPTLDDRGIPTRGLQTERIRVWPMTVALRHFGRSVPADMEERPLPDRYVVEHVETLAFGEMPARETWLLTVGKAKVFSKIASASADRQAFRYRTMARFGFSAGYVTHEGLLKHGQDKTWLVDAAADAGIAFVPIEELEAGIRLAALQYEISDQTRARFESVVQLTVPGFRRNDKGAPIPRHSHFVKPKHTTGGNPAEIPPLEINIAEAQLKELIAICELHKAMLGSPVFPVMVNRTDIGWKLDPAKFAASWGGRVLDSPNNNQCLMVLQAGWDLETLQDARNCLTEEAALDGEDEATTQIILDHGSAQTSGLYRANPNLARATRKAARGRKQDRRDADDVA